LDYELKRDYQRFLQRRNRARRNGSDDGSRDAAETVQEWAGERELPVLDGHVQFPDVRIEYERDDGRRAVEDVEVTTPHYRGAYAAAKARSGFTSYRATGFGRMRGQGSRRGRLPFDPRVAEEASHDTGGTRTRGREAGVHRTPSRLPRDRPAARLRLPRPPDCAYARIVRGQKVQDFFRSLVEREYATPHLFGHPKARVYHLQHRALYRAVGEPDARFRKHAVLGRAIERLMLLDHVLDNRELRWLATEREKVKHFLERR
jgi:hypothetical protein